MSQLLVTSAPVIYIFLLLERKQQKWSLLKRADTVNGKASWWVQCKQKHFVWGSVRPSTHRFHYRVMQIRPSHMTWHMVEISGVSSGIFAWIKTKRPSCEPPSQTEQGTLQTLIDWGCWVSSTQTSRKKGSCCYLGHEPSGLYDRQTSWKPFRSVPGVLEVGLQ